MFLLTNRLVTQIKSLNIFAVTESLNNFIIINPEMLWCIDAKKNKLVCCWFKYLINDAFEWGALERINRKDLISNRWAHFHFSFWNFEESKERNFEKLGVDGCIFFVS